MKHFLALIAVAFALSACTSTVDTARSYVDNAIKAAEVVDDKAMDKLAEGVAILEEEAERARLVKCRFPFTALLRYGLKSDANAAAVKRDCGLDINVVATP